MIVHVITGLSHGGAQNALYRLLIAQPDSTTSHVVSLMDDGIFGARLRAAGVKVTSLRIRGFYSSLKALLTLVRLLRRLRPAVVQTWMYHADLVGGIASRIAGVPVCWGIRNSNLSSEHTKFTTRSVVTLCAFLSPWLPTTIVSNSTRAADVHRRLGYADRFVIIPNGLDLVKFSPHPEKRSRLRKSAGLAEGASVVGHLARQDPQKDHPSLLAAFERLATEDSGVRLLLAGSGLEFGNSYLDSVLTSSRVSGQIIALGPRDDVEDLMQLMDVFVLSSSYGEAFPNVVVEAMACGIPCVVTDVGDAAEIVGETGWVVPTRDSAALAAALRKALDEQPEQRTARGQRARLRVEENYGIDGMVVAYHRVWSEVSGRVAD